VRFDLVVVLAYRASSWDRARAASGSALAPFLAVDRSVQIGYLT
jgi:hypothetical protein